jgi:hypothetical protein
MSPEVIQFINTLDVRMSRKFVLELIGIRVKAVSNYYIYGDERKKNDHKESLQQLFDLYYHVYKGNAPQSFHKPIILLNDDGDFS